MRRRNKSEEDATRPGEHDHGVDWIAELEFMVRYTDAIRLFYLVFCGQHHFLYGQSHVSRTTTRSICGDIQRAVSGLLRGGEKGFGGLLGRNMVGSQNQEDREDRSFQ